MSQTVKYLSIGLIFGIIIKFTVDHFPELEKYHIHFNGYFLAFSFFLSAVSFVCFALIWHYITIKNKCCIGLEKGLICWFYAEIGKYIPGKLLLVLGKVYYYSREGQSKRKVILCFYIETICTLLAQALVFVVSLLFVDLPVFRKFANWIYLLTGVFFVFLHPKIIQVLFSVYAKMFRKDLLKIKLIYSDILKITLLYLLNFLLIGVSYYYLINSIFSVKFSQLPFLLGTNCLAGMISMLSVFVPSGLGVREGVTLLALRNILPNSIAGIVTLLTRIWSSGTELGVVLLAFFYSKFRKIGFGDMSIISDS